MLSLLLVAALAGPRVAVAASAQDPVAALAAAYAKAGHPAPTLTAGATGKFYQQIQAGAPFDLLFAADDTYTRKLAGTRRVYARGRLALWSPGLDVRKGWGSLQGVRHLAIANPAVAPYGAAAVAAMKHAGVYGLLSHQLVLGESAAQATQFVVSGAAEAGVLPLSIVVSPRLAGKGSSWTVPAADHPPLTAEAVALTAAGTGFLDYATGAAAAPVWRKFGFEPVTRR
jgi:molybdate transport system substrate-binding protein